MLFQTRGLALGPSSWTVCFQDNVPGGALDIMSSHVSMLRQPFFHSQANKEPHTVFPGHSVSPVLQPHCGLEDWGPF